MSPTGTLSLRLMVLARYPTRETVSSLIYKRGHIRKDSKVLPLSTNQLVEESLGASGLICIEDVIHTLTMADKSAASVLNVLW